MWIFQIRFITKSLPIESIIWNLLSIIYNMKFARQFFVYRKSKLIHFLLKLVSEIMTHDYNILVLYCNERCIGSIVIRRILEQAWFILISLLETPTNTNKEWYFTEILSVNLKYNRKKSFQLSVTQYTSYLRPIDSRPKYVMNKKTIICASKFSLIMLFKY